MSSRESKQEPGEYAKFLRRCLRAMGRRIGGGDVENLTVLVTLRDEVDAEIVRQVASLRSADGGCYSWGEIASRLGVTPQAVQQKYGPKIEALGLATPGARKGGGQTIR
jgi:hypothetical protein